MAATAEARRLTEAHRVAQSRLGAQTVQQILATWRVLDPENIDPTVDAWLRLVVPLVQRQNAISARLAANYLTTFRTLELGVESVFVPPLATLDVDALTTSMVVTGPARLKSAMSAGQSLQRATASAQTSTARAAMRHAMSGGRDTISNAVTADDKSIGWARSASGSACGFCATLAGRGPVYSKESVDFRCHDGCNCSFEPVYRRLGRSAWPAGSAQYRDLYDEVAKGTSDPVNAMRKAVDA